MPCAIPLLSEHPVFPEAAEADSPEAVTMGTTMAGAVVVEEFRMHQEEAGGNASRLKQRLTCVAVCIWALVLIALIQNLL